MIKLQIIGFEATVSEVNVTRKDCQLKYVGFIDYPVVVNYNEDNTDNLKALRFSTLSKATHILRKVMPKIKGILADEIFPIEGSIWFDDSELYGLYPIKVAKQLKHNAHLKGLVKKYENLSPDPKEGKLVYSEQPVKRDKEMDQYLQEEKGRTDITDYFVGCKLETVIDNLLAIEPVKRQGSLEIINGSIFLIERKEIDLELNDLIVKHGKEKLLEAIAAFNQ